MGKYVDDKLDEIGSDYVVISRDANVVQELLHQQCVRCPGNSN